jgi:hypothetical protein
LPLVAKLTAMLLGAVTFPLELIVVITVPTPTVVVRVADDAVLRTLGGPSEV